MKNNLLADDLNYILERTPSVWDELRGQRIFITGGTGFFGVWLLEALTWANDQLNLNLSVTVLSRDPKAFAAKAPHLAHHPAIQFLPGDVRNFIAPVGMFSHVIHAATEASAKLNTENPSLMLETILQGTRRTLASTESMKPGKFLFVSSGAVYGRQPPEIECITEDYQCDIKDNKSAYGVGKFMAEQACIAHAQQHHYDMKIARGFAFVGPHLPLGIHFAIGNFIRDGLLGKTIHVNGDGTPFRSYLYAADMVIWLLRILCDGENGAAYNMGSDEGVSIADLARTVASCFDVPPEVIVAKEPDLSRLPERYVPSVQKAKHGLNLTERMSLQDAIKKTIAWCRVR